jgi:hypothetical protein
VKHLSNTAIMKGDRMHVTTPLTLKSTSRKRSAGEHDAAALVRQ